MPQTLCRFSITMALTVGNFRAVPVYIFSNILLRRLTVGSFDTMVTASPSVMLVCTHAHNIICIY